jgi:sugar phosphate isomerase/epimerase
MFLGYNTNGFAHHRLTDAISILADLGYRGIALTLDVHHLDPFSPHLAAEREAVARLLRQRGLHCVIETGSRFLLDPRRKHQPTLLSADLPERQIRLQFLAKCVQLARELSASCVSFWSGAPTDDAGPKVWMPRLVEACQRLADLAQEQKVKLAFEPEPGMFIDTMDRFAELHARVYRPNFGLTLDLGHLVCQRELPISSHIRPWKDWLWNVHVEDMRAGVHDHLMFGEGELDFADALAGLREVNYTGGLYVELSRHSHDAVNTARKSWQFLRGLVTESS